MSREGLVNDVKTGMIYGKREKGRQGESIFDNLFSWRETVSAQTPLVCMLVETARYKEAWLLTPFDQTLGHEDGHGVVKLTPRRLQ